MSELAPPPVPADADLTDFKFMPLEVARLRRSKAWLICKRRPELAFFMLNLWTAAWHERPAGSLEDDDDVLADAAMCSPERWAKVRKDALRGWVKAADGRLYHLVVAEKVMDSWHGKVLARWRKECDRVRKENHRRKEKGLEPLDFPPEPPRPSIACPTDDPPPSAGSPPENSLKGEGREREIEGTGKMESSLAQEPVDAAREPPPDNLDVPDFLRRGKPASTAQAITADWRPGPDARRNLEIARPDLTPERIDERTVEFIAWCQETNKSSHNPDSTWFRFVKGTREQSSREAHSSAAHGGAPTVTDGIAAAFARRSVPAGG